MAKLNLGHVVGEKGDDAVINGYNTINIVEGENIEIEQEEGTLTISANVDTSNIYTKEETNTLLNDKVDKITGKGLSTNDYTTEEKEKLADLENYDDTEIKQDIVDLETNKQDNLVFNTAYDATTNKVATMSDINTVVGNIESLLEEI